MRTDAGLLAPMKAPEPVTLAYAMASIAFGFALVLGAGILLASIGNVLDLAFGSGSRSEHALVILVVLSGPALGLLWFLITPANSRNSPRRLRDDFGAKPFFLLVAAGVATVVMWVSLVVSVVWDFTV